MDRGRQAGSQGSRSQPGLARAQARAPTVSRLACEPTRSAQRSYSSDAATFAVSRSPALSPFLPFKYTFRRSRRVPVRARDRAFIVNLVDNHLDRLATRPVS